MEELDKISEEVIEKYICKVYGKKHIDNVADARTQAFSRKYKANKLEEKLSCSKKFKSSITPPCHKVISQKKRR